MIYFIGESKVTCHRDLRRGFGLVIGFIGYLQVATTECSLCRLIRRPGSFSERPIGIHSGISRRTEGHSFGDHPISESVSVTPSNVIEASFYCALCCFMAFHFHFHL
jgi:hypothetical protein